MKGDLPVIIAVYHKVIDVSVIGKGRISPYVFAERFVRTQKYFVIKRIVVETVVFRNAPSESQSFRAAFFFLSVRIVGNGIIAFA